MKTAKSFSIKEIVFDNTVSKESTIIINVKKDTLIVDFKAIINTQFSGGNIREKYNKYCDFLGLGKYSKAPCGGFVNFYEYKSNLGKNYILYSGINEVSNSHYIVTVHKIIE